MEANHLWPCCGGGISLSGTSSAGTPAPQAAAAPAGGRGGGAEPQLSLAALGGLNADLGVDVHEQGRVVKANAARIRQVFEVEGGELMAAGVPGALHTSPQAHVTDIVPFGLTPNVPAL